MMYPPRRETPGDQILAGGAAVPDSPGEAPEDGDNAGAAGDEDAETPGGALPEAGGRQRGRPPRRFGSG